MYNSEIEDYFDLQEDSELDKKEMELKKSILLQKKLKKESFLNTGCLIKDNNNDNFNIELLKGCDFNFFFLKKIINLNFTFLLFYKSLYYDYFLKNNEIKNLNLFYFFIIKNLADSRSCSALNSHSSCGSIEFYSFS